ncbi:CPBP family intramembrane glutamic endopeptidase [Anaerobacillus sp. MEB173]|uniref:CPBP family intramembrane glutamic endopeptidase n=1 Tax=Anaerobacillus sp. MEB173 TaxID=3383345 RepID=UPI003F93AEDB
MSKRYWWILITYVAAQFSIFIGYPVLDYFGVAPEKIPGLWSVYSFSVGLIIILLLLRPDIEQRHQDYERVSRGEAIKWSFIGIFLAYGAQIVAAMIEMQLLGIEPGSENTEILIEIAKLTPIFMLVTAVIGPILEEIVFRKIIFGTLYKRYNFWIAAIISSLIFAAVHMDFTHLLIYTAMGFVFAYLYVRTKRIIVPIVAHVAMNSFVMLIQVVFGDKIMEMQKQLEEMQSFIGGFLL